MSRPASTKSATIIGAGVVGVCCAAYLQRAGYAITIVDPNAPGERCSFGNAGVIGPGACLPMAMPGIWRQVPGFLLDPLGPLSIRWRDFPRSVPWLIEWLKTSRASRAKEISSSMRTLHRFAFDCLMPLLNEADSGGLIRRDGQLYIASSNPAVLSEFSMSLLREAGVKSVPMTAAEVRDLEPAVAGAVGGLLFPDHGHSVDPFRVVQTLAALIVRRGGVLVRDRAIDFEKTDGRVTAVVCSGQRVKSDVVVVAAGAWSDVLAVALGTKCSMIAERGYHVTVRNPGPMPSRPVSHVDYRIAITPMDVGLRVAGTVEIAGVEAPPHPGRSEKLVKLVKAVIPGVNTDETNEWMGARPSLPDGLPLIDRSPNFSNAFFAFGHSHHGFMAAAPTGRLIAELVEGSRPFVDPKHFGLARL